MQTLIKVFGKRLADLHRATGLSQAEEVKHIKPDGKKPLGQSTFSSYTRGEKSPTLEALRALAVRFRVSTDYLCNLTDDPRPIDVILKRLQKLDLPEEVLQAAKMLVELPSQDRVALISQIEATRLNYIRWKSLAKLSGSGVDELRAAVEIITTEPDSDSVEQSVLELA